MCANCLHRTISGLQAAEGACSRMNNSLTLYLSIVRLLLMHEQTPSAGCNPGVVLHFETRLIMYCLPVPRLVQCMLSTLLHELTLTTQYRAVSVLQTREYEQTPCAKCCAQQAAALELLQ